MSQVADIILARPWPGGDWRSKPAPPPVAREDKFMLGSGKSRKTVFTGARSWKLLATGGATLLAGSIGVASITHDQAPVAAAPAAHRAAIPATALAPAPRLAPDPTAAPPAASAAPVHVSTVSTPVTPRASTGPRQVKPAVLKARTPAPAAAVAAVSHTNYLTSDDGTLHTGVGTYSDCSGNSVLSNDEAAILTCVTGRLYFVGHNYGVFTPLIHMGAGDGITYWDAASVAHHYRVVAVVPAWQRASGPPPLSQPNVTAQFQTCATPDGQVDRILNAVSDPGSGPTVLSPVIAAAAPVVSTVTTTTTTATNTGSWSTLLGNLFGHR